MKSYPQFAPSAPVIQERFGAYSAVTTYMLMGQSLTEYMMPVLRCLKAVTPSEQLALWRLQADTLVAQFSAKLELAIDGVCERFLGPVEYFTISPGVQL